MPPECPFCLENNALQDVPLFHNDGFFVLGMLAADRQDALMVIPLRHIETPFDLLAEEWGHLAGALDFARKRLAVYRPDGFSVGWNVGAAGGQHVAHAHMHVICRYDGQPASALGLNGLIKRVNGADKA